MRDKFEEWAKDFVKTRHEPKPGQSGDDLPYTSPYTQAAWEGWQAGMRAKSPSVSLDAGDLKRALDIVAPDMTAEQMETPVTISYFADGHSGPGYYAYCSEYPEEGCDLISTPDK